MSEAMTEAEAAQYESGCNTAWQEIIDSYLANFPESEKECQAMAMLMSELGFRFAANVLAVAMLKLHGGVGQQTGEMLQNSDLEEGYLDKGDSHDDG